jgi:uncharacterized membrane protein YphA (DoxX/SURF4 family)
MAPRSRGAGITLSGMRILLGVLFLTVWGSNLHKGIYGPDSYAGVIRGYVVGGEAPALWKEMMGFVADHASVFARLQFVGELTLGALLVLGLWLRVVGVLAWAFLLGLWISEIGAPGEWAWSLVFPAIVALAVAFVPEARCWSLDGRRHG